ncbi:proline-rich protein 36 [Ixodes scapularis]
MGTLRRTALPKRGSSFDQLLRVSACRKKGRKKSPATEDALEGNSRFGNVPPNDETPESEVVERLAQAAGEWTAVPLPEGEGDLLQVPTGGALQADRSAITLREDVSSVRFEEEVNFEILPPEDPTELQELEQLLEQLSGSSTSLGARPPAGAPAAKSRPTSPALR